jgi:hypothetical protein
MEIRDLPHRVVPRQRLHPLLDGVLVRAGERRVDQVAHVGVAGMDRQAVAVLGHPAQSVDVRDVQLGIDPLGEQVHGQGDHVDVAGPLAVAEEGPLDAVGAGQHAQLGRRDRAAPVVVRMEGQHDTVAPGDPPQEPLDGVGVEIRRVHLDGGRQVQDELPVGCGLDDVGDRLADLDGELRLGARVALRRVLVEDLRAAHRLLELPAELRGVDGDVDDARLVQPEDHPPLQDRGRVVEVHDGTPGAPHALVGPVDQLGPALHQHLDGHVVRNQVLLDQDAHEVVVGLGRRREPDLDLLEAHPHERVEHSPLARRVHRIDEGLVTVAEIDRAPAGSLRELPVRPGPVGELEGHERAVLAERHAPRSHRRWWHLAPLTGFPPGSEN